MCCKSYDYFYQLRMLYLGGGQQTHKARLFYITVAMLKFVYDTCSWAETLRF